MKLPIKVVPASSRSCLAGWLGDALKIRVSAPAEHGKANAAAAKIVAEALKVPRRRVSITSGKTSAHKIVEIHGLTESEVQRRLSNLIT